MSSVAPLSLSMWIGFEVATADHTVQLQVPGATDARMEHGSALACTELWFSFLQQ